MKQIKGIFLFLMSVVLVAFGSQDSKNSKGLVKKLEDGTKEVGKSIVGKKNKTVKADNKKEVAKKEENKEIPLQNRISLFITTTASSTTCSSSGDTTTTTINTAAATTTTAKCSA